MATWSLTSSAAAVTATSGQLIKARLAITTTASAVASTNAWPYTLEVLGDITTIPWFDAPPGFPRPILPGP